MNIGTCKSIKSHCLRARRPIRPTRPIRPALISGFPSMKRLGVFRLPPGWDASPLQGYPQHFAGTHLYTWVGRGTVRVKCLAQEHNTMSPAWTRTRTTRSGVEHSNHEATAPPMNIKSLNCLCLICLFRVAQKGQAYTFNNCGARGN